MSIDVAFKFLKILNGRGADNWNGFPQVRSARKVTFIVAVAFR